MCLSVSSVMLLLDVLVVVQCFVLALDVMVFIFWCSTSMSPCMHTYPCVCGVYAQKAWVLVLDVMVFIF
jgi:hypothetical protein